MYPILAFIAFILIVLAINFLDTYMANKILEDYTPTEKELENAADEKFEIQPDQDFYPPEVKG